MIECEYTNRVKYTYELISTWPNSDIIIECIIPENKQRYLLQQNVRGIPQHIYILRTTIALGQVNILQYVHSLNMTKYEKFTILKYTHTQCTYSNLVVDKILNFSQNND